VKELLDLLRVIPFKNNLDEKIKKNCDLNFTLLILGATQYYLGLVDDALTTCLEATKVFESQEIEKLDNISQYYLVDAWADLGCVYIYLGQYVKAERILNEAILWLDKLFTNHPRQARTYAEQALLMYHLGKFKEGKVLLNKCSKIRELSYSPQHQQQADTQIKLGFINITLGKINSAKQNFRRAEKIYKIYNDGDLVRIFVNLGFWKIYESTGKHKLAKNYMDTTIKMAKLQFKNKTSTMMSSQLTQAETWAQTIVHTDLPYWQHALEVNQQLFGNDHYQTAKYHYILGLTLSNIHKKQEAFNHYNQALYILSSQKIRHPNLKKFYVSNIKRIQLKLKDLK
jgi:tetratricopeptide (TPR) repeat protein